MPETTEPGGEERTVYELGYHIVPTVGESGLPEEVSNLKNAVLRHGGIFIMEEYPVMTQLAYTIVKAKTGKRDKHAAAYFGWVKFELESRHVARLKEDLDQSEHLLRYLLITTVREDTRVPKRVFSKQQEGKTITPKTAPEKSAPISEEELDRSIAVTLSTSDDSFRGLRIHADDDRRYALLFHRANDFIAISAKEIDTYVRVHINVAVHKLRETRKERIWHTVLFDRPHDLL